jgi:hypothetical protein
MEGHTVTESGPTIWHYEGLGIRKSFDNPRFWVLGTCIAVAATIYGYVVIAPRGRIEPGRVEMHKTDFTVFTEAGAAFFDGRDPYRVTNPRGWHYLYPPLFALLVSPLTVFDTASQVAIWYALNVVLSFGCFLEARRLWRLLAARAGAFPTYWVIACVALCAFLPFLDCMQAGQLGIAILYLLIVGFRLVLEKRSWRSGFLTGVLLALPAAVKLVPALPVVCLLLQQWSAVAFREKRRRPWRQASALSAGVLAGAFLFLLAVPASMLGWQKNLGYLSTWQTGIVSNQRLDQSKNFNIRSARNQSLANAVYLSINATSRAGVPRSTAFTRAARADRMVHPAVRVATGIAILLLLSIGVVLGRRKSILDQATAYSLALCATLVVSPLAWGHYYMALVPAVLCVPLWLWSRGWLGFARSFAVIPPILSWAHYLAMPYVGEAGVLGLGTAAWFLCACCLILWIERSSAKTRLSGRTRRDSAQENVYRPLILRGGHQNRGRRAAERGYFVEDRRTTP